MVLVEGPVGTGKSAVLNHAVAVAHELGFTVASGGANRTDQLRPFTTLATILKSCDDFRPVLTSLDEMVDDHLKLLDRLRIAMKRILATRRLVIAIDDFQMSDELTALIVHMLSVSFRGEPILWVIGGRPRTARTPAMSAIESLIGGGAVRTRLGRLTDDEVADLCAAVLGVPAGPDVLELVARASGNPLLCDALLRSLLGEDLITVRGGFARLTDGVSHQWVPARYEAAMVRLLEGLSPAATSLLAAGAVFGTRFTLLEAASLTGWPMAEVLLAATDAIAADMLTDCGPELAFRHELVPHLVHDRLGELVRMGARRQVATVVRAEARGAEEVDRHLRSGIARAVATTSDVLMDLVRAREPGAGVDFALRALDLLGDRHPLAGNLVVEAVRLLGSSGQWTRAAALGERALRGSLDADAETTLLLRLIELTQDGGECAVATEYTRRVLARPALPVRFRAQLFATLAHNSAVKGDPSGAERMAREATTLSPVDQRDTLMGSLLARGVAAWAQCEFTRGTDLVRQAVNLADESGFATPLRDPRAWLGVVLTDADRFEEADAVCAVLVGQTDVPAREFVPAIVRYQQARLRFAQGRLAEAQIAASTGVAVAETERVPALLVRLLCLTVELHLAQDDVIAAERSLQRAEQLADRVSGAERAEVLWRRVLVHEATGRFQDAARGALALHSAAGTSLFPASGCSVVAPSLVRLMLGVGDVASARAVASAVHELVAKNPAVPSIGATATHVDGLIENDPVSLEAAAELYRRGSRQPAAAAAWEDAGRAAANRGDSVRAGELRRRSRVAWASCGATRYAKRVTAELREPGDTAPQSWTATPSPRESAFPTPPADAPAAVRTTSRLANLTDTELRVSRLVATGMTNKEIATRLVLSPHTVGTHIRNSFSKLDVTNRVELAVKVLVHDCTNQLPAG